MNEVVSTLKEICRHQKRAELVRILDNARSHFASINFDNWNGGTTTWALRLEVPTVIFALSQQRLQEIEKELLQKLEYLDRLNPNDPLGEVSITPSAAVDNSLGQSLSPSDLDMRRIWGTKPFRLFLSHVSAHRAQVSSLSKSLAERGISAFVAHESIEPSRQWQDEISMALRSMHALAAVLTTDFHKSNWTDQEIGWTLGRGIQVVSVRVGLDPYGFIGSIQGIPGSLEKIEDLANKITLALLADSRSHSQMRLSLVDAFFHAKTFNTADLVGSFILGIEDFSESEIAQIREACDQNEQVKGAHEMRKKIISRFGEQNDATDLFFDVPF